MMYRAAGTIALTGDRGGDDPPRLRNMEDSDDGEIVEPAAGRQRCTAVAALYSLAATG